MRYSLLLNYAEPAEDEITEERSRPPDRVRRA